MGIDPTIWGANMWAMIHLICIHAPEKIDANVRNTYSMFFSMMPYVLPCEKCRDHWLDHISQYPIEQSLNTRKDLFHWSVNMHNLVNKSLNKPEITYERAYEHWTDVSNGKIPITRCIADDKEYFQILSEKTKGYSNLQIFLLVIFFLLILLILGFVTWYVYYK